MRHYDFSEYDGVRPGQLRHDLESSKAERVPMYVLVHSLGAQDGFDGWGTLCVVTNWQWFAQGQHWLGSQVQTSLGGELILLTAEEVQAMPIVGELHLYPTTGNVLTDVTSISAD